jgi:hypothetical protein
VALATLIISLVALVIATTKLGVNWSRRRNARQSSDAALAAIERVRARQQGKPLTSIESALRDEFGSLDLRISDTTLATYARAIADDQPSSMLATAVREDFGA